METYINNRGYIIRKDKVNVAIINKIKRELIIKPIIFNQYNEEEKDFPIYLENSKKIYIQNSMESINLVKQKRLNMVFRIK